MSDTIKKIAMLHNLQVQELLYPWYIEKCHFLFIYLFAWANKPDLSDKIKWEFFQVIAVSVLLYSCTT